MAKVASWYHGNGVGVEGEGRRTARERYGRRGSDDSGLVRSNAWRGRRDGSTHLGSKRYLGCQEGSGEGGEGREWGREEQERHSQALARTRVDFSCASQNLKSSTKSRLSHF